VQEVSYSGRIPQLLEERVFRPAVRLALVGAAHARRLQTGRLGTYVAYLIALVLVLLTATKIGLIG
jgi:hydrogenase-4 component B